MAHPDSTPASASVLLRQVEASSGQAIHACYQCGGCSAGCPMAPWMDQLPNQLIHRLQMGQDVTGYESPWLCVSAHACQIVCPKAIDVPRVMEAIRRLTLRAGTDHSRLRSMPADELAQLPAIALVALARKGTS